MTKNEDKVRNSLNKNFESIDSFFQINKYKLNGLNATQLAYKYIEQTKAKGSVEHLRKLFSIYLKDLKMNYNLDSKRNLNNAFVVESLEEMSSLREQLADSIKGAMASTYIRVSTDGLEVKKEKIVDFKSQNLTFDINEWIEQGKKQQILANKASGYLEKELDIEIPTDRKQIAIMLLSDLHFGSYGANYDEIQRLTDIILNTNGLYVILGGDICEMAIKMRGVKEISGNMFTPEQQMDFLDKWLDKIKHKVLFAIWGNHESERLENAGSSEYSRIIRRYTNYIDGIAHVNLKVGDEIYKIAASHRFRGAVTNHNPTSSTVRYMETSGKGWEIGLAGDSHMSGMTSWINAAGEPRLALNAGTLHTDSHFSKRYFSLIADQRMPVFTLHTKKHSFNGFSSVDDWKDSLTF